MPQSESQKAAMLATAAMQAGVIAPALEDALRRGMQQFQGRDIDSIDTGTWVDGLKVDCPQYFPHKSAAPSQGFSDAQAAALNRLPPVERLTKFREWQARTQGGSR
jgi:hypothetical protein